MTASRLRLKRIASVKGVPACRAYLAYVSVVITRWRAGRLFALCGLIGRRNIRLGQHIRISPRWSGDLIWAKNVAILLQRKHQTIIQASRTAAVCLLCFVNPSLQYWHKENVWPLVSISRSRATHMSVVFCKPILAILLQRKHQTIIVDISLFIVFCKTILCSARTSYDCSNRRFVPVWVSGSRVFRGLVQTFCDNLRTKMTSSDKSQV